ncbi:MAG: AMP-binding protein [Bacteroidota bacterium]
MDTTSAFIQRVGQNKYFKIIDAATGKEYLWNDVVNAASLPNLNGQTAFLYVDNSANSLIAFFQFYVAGAVLALLPKNLQQERKDVLEATYNPLIIFDESRPTINNYVSETSGLLSWHQSPIPGHQSPIATQIKILLSTSGTTGSPKLVKLSEENLLANADSILGFLPIQESDIAPLNLPVYYSYGLSVLTTHALAGGTMVCGLADVIQKEFWLQWEQFAFTSLAGVPFSYEMLNRLGFFKKDLPSLRYFTQAGGKLNKDLVVKAATYAAETGKQFFVMYGQTEATARMSWLPPGETLAKPTSIGIAIPGGKFSVDSETNELLYSGKNVFGGYAETKADLSSFEPEDFLRTGDVATMDEDGFVYITGRMKRFVKLFGNRIGLDEMEDIIKNTFGMQPVCCNGVEDKFLLISHTSSVVDEKVITAFLFTGFGIHPTAIRWNALAALPLTANGKIDYQQIIKDYEGR